MAEHPEYDRRQSWMVGDGVTDVQAGKRLSLRTAFLGPRKWDAARIFGELAVVPDFWGADLAEFATHLTEAGGMPERSFSATYLAESVALLERLDVASIEAVATGLAQVRDRGGRLFILGVGGSAGHAGHAVNDFRKICGFEAYTPTDNVAELTARINDEGWDTCFSEWLKVSRISRKDAVLVFSVGGGNQAKNVSVSLVRALEVAKEAGARVFGIVGKDGGFTREVADACILVPVVSPHRITPHTEGFCAVLWHLLVSHPALKVAATKWESLSGGVRAPLPRTR